MMAALTVISGVASSAASLYFEPGMDAGLPAAMTVAGTLPTGRIKQVHCMPTRTDRCIWSTLVIVAILLGASADASAQQGARGGEWRYYGGDSGSTKYSSLDRIYRGP